MYVLVDNSVDKLQFFVFPTIVFHRKSFCYSVMKFVDFFFYCVKMKLRRWEE